MNATTRILIAEDDDTDAFLLERVLVNAQLSERVKFVKDGQEAIDFMTATTTATPPRLILLDLKMPRLNGFDVLRWKQSKPELNCVPVVVLTSSEQTKDIRLAYDLGANSYLAKPHTIEALTELVNLVKKYWIEENRLPEE